MMQILANVVFKPTALPHEASVANVDVAAVPLTFKAMVNDIGTAVHGGVDGLRAAFERKDPPPKIPKNPPKNHAGWLDHVGLPSTCISRLFLAQPSLTARPASVELAPSALRSSPLPLRPTRCIRCCPCCFRIDGQRANARASVFSGLEHPEVAGAKDRGPQRRDRR